MCNLLLTAAATGADHRDHTEVQHNRSTVLSVRRSKTLCFRGAILPPSEISSALNFKRAFTLRARKYAGSATHY